MEAALERDAVPTYIPRAVATGEVLEPERLLEAPLKSMPRPSILDAPITKLKGAGPKLAAAASEMGIESLGDLLRHVPHSYRDRANPVGLGDLRLGEEATVEVEVAGAKLRPTRRRRLTILEADVFDPSGKVKAVWFNRAWLADRLQPGTRLLLRGKLEKRGFNVSEHEFLDAPGRVRRPPYHRDRARCTPRASACGRSESGSGSGRRRRWPGMRLSRSRAACAVSCGWRARAIRSSPRISRSDEHAAEAARERLAFEELFLYQAALVSRRGTAGLGRKGIELSARRRRRVGAWLESLPFQLTGDQGRAMEEIDSDLGQAQPMQRLLMGEVGSGQDRARPLRDAARDRGRAPGRPDGAHRDARRAALPHARVPARLRGQPRRPCSPRRRRRPSAASCSTRWRPGSRSSSSAPMP